MLQFDARKKLSMTSSMKNSCEFTSQADIQVVRLDKEKPYEFCGGAKGGSRRSAFWFKVLSIS